MTRARGRSRWAMRARSSRAGNASRFLTIATLSAVVQGAVTPLFLALPSSSRSMASWATLRVVSRRISGCVGRSAKQSGSKPFAMKLSLVRMHSRNARSCRR